MQLVQSANNGATLSAGNGAAGRVLVGLVGSNIQRSRTPRMHEVEGARLGLNYTYQVIDTAGFAPGAVSVGDVLNAAKICGFAGLNVTYPHKQAIAPLLDGLSEDASRIGAVNTVVFGPTGTIGHNTDKFGFAEGFRHEMSGAPLGSVLQIGAGGAGAAVASALIELGVENIHVTDVEPERAEALVARLQPTTDKSGLHPISVSALASLQVDGIVNTTPVGMDATPGLPIDPGFLTSDIWIADIIYFPLETALLQTARALGCRTMSGAPMAIFQAVKAFELFTGKRPDSAEMKSTFDAFEGTEVEAL